MEIHVYSNSRKGLCLNSIKKDFKGFLVIPEGSIGIVFVLSGSAVINAQSLETLLGEGEGLMIKRTSSIKVISLKEDFTSLVCSLDIQVLSAILSTLPCYALEPNQVVCANQIRVPSIDSIKLLVKSLHSYHQNNFHLSPEWSEISENMIKEFFWLLYHSNIHKELSGFLYSIRRPNRFVFDDLIEKHFKDNLTLSELAHLGGYSISTFKRKFESIYNSTPGKLILNRRLEEAFFLLQNSDKTVNEICYEVGFKNPSHFIKSFKCRYGITPKQQTKRNVA
ncbi:AraC family transcriptional regulator [Cytophagales bacterium LB-30]|uniref:AraC family transcriptional regulator n=1 Tax=Shiella aurantiaca TaxID=3058365 RepID=A0ABT8F511_9BACT|nr:AraC family transcriptional regulator [Shiella aurantiaca]MDN4165553.1 AraC family transcriptional regulator [Shiella aurantiaca]